MALEWTTTREPRPMRTLALILITLAFGGIIGGGIVTSTSHLAPKCPEDAVLVGTGDFSGGYWTSYVCENLD